MTSPNAKAPAATEAIENRKPVPFQKEGFTGNSSLPDTTVFATIHVAGLTVAPGVMTGGDQPDELVVTMRSPDALLSFTPAEACALAAALSAVGVFQMEEPPRIITRRTAPGAPSFEEGI